MVEVSVSPLKDVANFIEQWNALYACCQPSSFFQSPHWVRAWIDGTPTDQPLFQVQGFAGDRLVLLGAFAVPKRKHFGIGLKETWFHEFGDAKCDSIYVEYNDFLVANDAPADIRKLAVESILKLPSNVDTFVFRNVKLALSEAVIAASQEKNFNVRIERKQPVYVCNLSDGDFAASLSKSLRSKINRSLRIYKERGDVIGATAKTEEEINVAWSALLRLHAAGWSARGEESVFDNPHLISFHERLKKNGPEMVDLFVVKAGSDVIAVLYNFIHNKRVMNYQCGFLFEDDNRLAPGFVAHMLAAEHYQRLGFETYDLLAGEADYKSRLGSVESSLKR